MTGKTDIEIVQDTLDGNVEAFRFIIKRYQKMSYRVAFSIIRQHQQSEEVVQDSFLKAFRSLSSFKKEAKFSTWLFRIVYYTSLNALEKIKTTRHHQDLEGSEVFSHSVPNQGQEKLLGDERSKYLHLALNKLNPDDKLALTLYYLEEQPHKEISELTGWSLESTKVRIHRARTKLDQSLQELLKNEKRSLL